MAVLTGGIYCKFYSGKTDFSSYLSLVSVYIYVYIYIYGIPVHVAVKIICLTIGLWIFLSKDKVLLLLQYDTGGEGGQSAVLPGKAENLRNVNCSCHGSVVPGGG